MAKLAPLRAEGLELAIFPSGDFGNQELGTDAEIVDFAKGKGFEGIIFTKGPCNSRPVFQTLQALSGGAEIAELQGPYVSPKTGEVSEVKDDIDVEELIKAKLAE